jgi:hypothetical protein
MATDAAGSEIQAFYEFLGRRMEDPAITPEQSVQEFRAYQDELRRAQAELRESHEELRQGKAKPLDADALMERVRSRLARQGSTP